MHPARKPWDNSRGPSSRGVSASSTPATGRRRRDDLGRALKEKIANAVSRSTGTPTKTPPRGGRANDPGARSPRPSGGDIISATVRQHLSPRRDDAPLSPAERAVFGQLSAMLDDGARALAGGNPTGARPGTAGENASNAAPSASSPRASARRSLRMDPPHGERSTSSSTAPPRRADASASVGDLRRVLADARALIHSRTADLEAARSEAATLKRDLDRERRRSAALERALGVVGKDSSGREGRFCAEDEKENEAAAEASENGGFGSVERGGQRSGSAIGVGDGDRRSGAAPGPTGSTEPPPSADDGATPRPRRRRASFGTLLSGVFAESDAAFEAASAAAAAASTALSGPDFDVETALAEALDASRSTVEALRSKLSEEQRRRRDAETTAEAEASGRRAALRDAAVARARAAAFEARLKDHLEERYSEESGAYRSGFEPSSVPGSVGGGGRVGGGGKVGGGGRVGGGFPPPTPAAATAFLAARRARETPTAGRATGAGGVGLAPSPGLVSLLAEESRRARG